MLGKLIKFEFKASGRILLPLYVAIFFLGVFASIGTRFSGNFLKELNFVQLIIILLVVLYILFISAGLILSLVISIMRFKNSLFGPEGYIMNTLPVHQYENILSKVIVAVIYQILAIIVSAVSGFIFMLIVCSAQDDAINLTRFFSELKPLFSQYGGAIVLYSIEAIIFGIACLFYTNLIIYASISIGHSSNSHKIILSVAAYIGFYIISQIISFTILKFWPGLTSMIHVSHIYSAQPFIIGMIIYNLIYCGIYFAITNYFLKNKLNLQ